MIIMRVYKHNFFFFFFDTPGYIGIRSSSSSVQYFLRLSGCKSATSSSRCFISTSLDKCINEWMSVKSLRLVSWFQRYLDEDGVEK